MIRQNHRIALCAMAVSLQLSALPSMAAPGAQGTWRCANNTYTDQPCVDGKAIDASDSRSDADRRAADNATRRAGVTASAMQRERLRSEAEARRENSRPAIIAAPVATAAHRQTAPSFTRNKKKAANSDYFTSHEATFSGSTGSGPATASPPADSGTKRRKSRS